MAQKYTKDELGTRMKEYENANVTYLPNRLPVILRLDGKSFHSYTKPLKKRDKPFDQNLIEVMNDTAIKLCDEIQGVKLAYVQSDEISLLLNNFDNFNSQAWFQNKIQKIVSVSAAIASSTFTINSNKIWGNEYKPAYFDSRAFVLPFDEVCNYFIWRQKDTIRNSVQTLARTYYSHKACNNKSCDELKEMCRAVSVYWDTFPNEFKLGRCVTKQNYLKNNALRSCWVVDNNIPNFVENREYVDKFLKKAEKEKE